jgi:hypothetical protein
LAVLGEQQYLPVFMKALEDKSPLVALLSARALATWGEPAVAEHLLPALQRFEAWNPNVLASLLVSLGKTVAPSLRTNLRNTHHSSWVRTIAMKALTELRDPLATPLAVEILRQEKDINLQIAAIQLLAQMGGSEHIPLIRQRYNSPFFPVRLHAIRALGILSNATIPPFARPLMTPRLGWQWKRPIAQNHRSSPVLHELDLAEHPRSELAGQMLGSLIRLSLSNNRSKIRFCTPCGQVVFAAQKTRFPRGSGLGDSPFL